MFLEDVLDICGLDFGKPILGRKQLPGFSSKQLRKPETVLLLDGGDGGNFWKSAPLPIGLSGGSLTHQLFLMLMVLLLLSSSLLLITLGGDVAACMEAVVGAGISIDVVVGAAAAASMLPPDSLGVM